MNKFKEKIPDQSGLLYLVNYNRRLISPKEAPENWNSIGRFFVRNHELEDIKRGNESVASIYNEMTHEASLVPLRLEMEQQSSEKEVAMITEIPNIGKFKWISAPINRSSNRFIEVTPASKMQLELLYRAHRVFFIGTNYTATSNS